MKRKNIVYDIRYIKDGVQYQLITAGRNEVNNIKKHYEVISCTENFQ